jgi:hypothetical protein
MPSRRRRTPADYGLTKLAYSRREVMESFGYSEGFLHKLIRVGQLRPSKSGKKTMFYAVDLIDHIESTRQRTANRKQGESAL